jgi:hypothetical protein
MTLQDLANEKITILIDGPKTLTITHTSRIGTISTLISESTGHVQDKWWLFPILFEDFYDAKGDRLH